MSSLVVPVPSFEQRLKAYYEDENLFCTIPTLRLNTDRSSVYRVRTQHMDIKYTPRAIHTRLLWLQQDNVNINQSDPWILIEREDDQLNAYCCLNIHNYWIWLRWWFLVTQHDVVNNDQRTRLLQKIGRRVFQDYDYVEKNNKDKLLKYHDRIYRCFDLIIVILSDDYLIDEFIQCNCMCDNLFDWIIDDHNPASFRHEDQFQYYTNLLLLLINIKSSRDKINRVIIKFYMHAIVVGVEVYNTPFTGLGVRSRRSMTVSNQPIDKISGPIINNTDGDITAEEAEYAIKVEVRTSDKQSGKKDKTKQIMRSMKWHWSRYVNHSPSLCQIEVRLDGYIYVIKDIHPGDQIFMDYGL